MKTPIEYPDVESLHFGCEDAESRDIDWSEGYGEDWVAYEAIEDVECSCGWMGTVVASAAYFTCPGCDEGHDCDSAEGPMMNSYYPLPDHANFSSEDAAKLHGLPLCLVNFSDGSWRDDLQRLCRSDRPDWALALTGGGMDLSWEIAEAHMRLGLLPPLFACRLPRYAGKDMTSPRNAWIIAGCKRTAEVVSGHAQRVAYDLEQLGAE